MVSVASRIGAASSPFVVEMTRINAIFPFALMGSLSFIAAVFCWLLPETLGKHTAEVMEDTEKQQGTLFSITLHTDTAICMATTITKQIHQQQKSDKSRTTVCFS